MWFNNFVNAKVRIIFNIQNIWRLFFKFSLFHLLYTQNWLNLFLRWQHILVIWWDRKVEGIFWAIFRCITKIKIIICCFAFIYCISKMRNWEEAFKGKSEQEVNNNYFIDYTSVRKYQQTVFLCIFAIKKLHRCGTDRIVWDDWEGEKQIIHPNILSWMCIIRS